MSELMHQASKYYDPQKAHEYYMRTRELKGRTSTAKLNDTGKEAASYIKQQLLAEKKDKTRASFEKKIANLQDLRDYTKQVRKEEAAKQAQRIKNHAAAMKAKADSLRRSLDGLKGDARKQKAAQIKSELEGMRNENKKQQEKLAKDYKEIVDDINTSYKDIAKDYSNEHKKNVAQYKQEYQTKYEAEIAKLNSDRSMQKVKKAKKGRRRR